MINVRFKNCYNALFYQFLKVLIVEINPYLEHIKDLTDRGNQLRGYL